MYVYVRVKRSSINKGSGIDHEGIDFLVSLAAVNKRKTARRVGDLLKEGKG